MKVKVRKLHDDAVLPKYNYDKSSIILSCISRETTLNYIEYDTGLVPLIPEGYVGVLFPMNSVSDRDLVIKDSIGVIESGNEDSLKVRFWITEDYLPSMYQIGEDVVQVVLMPYTPIECEWE